MAAYAALVSLMNTMEQILTHPRFSSSFDKRQAESLGERIGFLLDFIESHNSHGGSKEEVEDLERQIASAAHAAEDVIESHIVDQIHVGSNKTTPIPSQRKKRKVPTCLLDLQRIIVDMDSIKEKVMKVKEERGHKDQSTYSMPAASSRPLSSIGKTTMVGFDEYLAQLLDGLKGYQSDRLIIPIVGMPGIGKTTLAGNAYEHSLIVQHFDVRVWVTVSQEYNARKFLLEALSCLGVSSSGMDENTDDELGERLYKTLTGKRYLIILDDMWSIEAWNKMKFFFPDNCDGCRIIVTTRLSDVAGQFGSSKLAVNLLDDDASWNLFCQKVFGQEECPHELEEVGKKIVKNCGGLPLSIIVIGGILGKSSRTQEYWANVAKDVSSILNSAENDECLNILSLSYRHLPACLKPCFLYLGIFPEDHEIRVSQLIKLWVAEGFIRANTDQSFEEIAEDYIKNLIDRNLILVRRLGRTGRLKTCYIHDLLRDLCLKIAEQEKFLYAMKLRDTSRDIDRERRLIIHGSASEEPQVLRTLESTPLARSLIYKMPGNSRLVFKSRLLRVLLFEDYPDEHYLEAALQQVNLRFFASSWDHPWSHPWSVSSFWNLQTLITDISSTVTFVAPVEIWEMRQLRHLKIDWFKLPDPPPIDEQDDCVVLRNLQTLETVENFRCSEEVIKRMPNIKKLQICYRGVEAEVEDEDEVSYYCLYNLHLLNKLESLMFFFPEEPNAEFLFQDLTFPSSLKRLHLVYCELRWNELTIIGSLPHLEVLIFDWGLIEGAEWNPVEGGFPRLKFLQMDNCRDLIHWNADKSHFPVLENLSLYYAEKLNEIPSDIGEIPTLQRIYLPDCGVSVGISAAKILKEQQKSFENESLRLEVSFRDPEKRKEFREEMQKEGITVRNFKLY